MKNDNYLMLRSERWQRDIPYDTRQLAIKECITCYKSCETKMKNGLIAEYDIQFKTKKNPTQMFHVVKSALKHYVTNQRSKNSNTKQNTTQMVSTHLFVSRFKNKKDSKIRTSKREKRFLDAGTEGDFVIQKQANRWYIYLLKKKLKNDTNHQSSTSITESRTYQSVFLDPGVRSFQSFYSPDGVCGHINDGYNQRLYNLLKKADCLQSRLDTSNRWFTHKNKRVNRHRLKRKIRRLRNKVTNVVNDLHWQFGNFVCKHFDNIIIPVFKTSDLVKKQNRMIGKVTTRMLNVFQHYKFRQRLHYLANKFEKQVVVCKEPYTSKTCGRCGNVKYDLQGAKIYHCDKCNLTIDRDYNGARNNGLAYFVTQRANWERV
jgi:transposase